MKPGMFERDLVEMIVACCMILAVIAWVGSKL